MDCEETKFMAKKLLYYFEGFDNSILKLNDFISDDGFEFTRYDLKEFEIKFKHLLTERDDSIQYQNRVPDYDISVPFFDGLLKSKYFNHNEILDNKYVVFLDDKQVAKYQDMENENDYVELDIRVENLINKLKLFKSGYFKLISAFPIYTKIDWHFNSFPVLYSFPSKIIFSIYTLAKEDFNELQYFKSRFSIPEYLRLAFSSFIECYNIEDEKLKFLMLIICLESIFNKSSKEPIMHIISRHAALTITRDKQAFHDTVKQVKFLYDLRSWIVHGKDDDKEHRKYKKYIENISDHVSALEELVRKILKQLIWNDRLFDSNKPTNRDELFDILNASAPLVGPLSN